MIKKMTQYLLQRRCALSLLLMLMLLQPAMAQKQTRIMYARLDRETQTLTLYYGSNYKESDYGISLLFGRPLYGAQNETYMSRSAEKWVRGLCFNELGVCG